MSRLTEREPYWENEEYWLDTEPDGYEVDRVYLKLRDYENTELEPVEVERLKHELEVCKRALELVLISRKEMLEKQNCFTCSVEKAKIEFLDQARKEFEDERN